MIRVTTLLTGLALLILPIVASAQTSFYGMLTCDAVSAQRSQADKIGATNSDAAVKSNAGAKDGSGENGGKFGKGGRAKNGGVNKSSGGPSGANVNGGSADNANRRSGGATGPNARSTAAAVAQEKCSWTLPVQIGNDIAMDGVNTFNLNVTGNQSSDTGSHTSTTNTSDQFTLSFTGTSVLDGSEIRSRQGTWKFTNGTGSLKGITGSGTYTAVARAAGGMSYDLEGNYELPSKTPAAPALGAPDASGTPKPVS